MSRLRYEDRRAAGRALAQKLDSYKDKAVVFALPRGGVETAVEIAQALAAPLDLIIARKIGHPAYGEYAIGAVTESGPVIWNEAEAAALDPAWLKRAEASERREARRRRQTYLEGRHPVSARGKVAIVVDDGIATGLTMRAALGEISKQGPDKVVVAVPVAPADCFASLLKQADEVLVLIDPKDFRGAVGAHYENFPQLSDQEVINLLANNDL